MLRSGLAITRPIGVRPWLSAWPEINATSPASCLQQYCSRPSGAGTGPRNRSVEQEQTGGPGPARSPDAPADVTDHVGNRGSDPEDVVKHASGKAHEALSSKYDSKQSSRPASSAAVGVQANTFRSPGYGGEMKVLPFIIIILMPTLLTGLAALSLDKWAQHWACPDPEDWYIVETIIADV
eukprot:jgi/Chrzof1/14121/Cz08g25250.t1